MRPSSLDEILRLRAENPGKLKYLAGATFRPRLEEGKTLIVDLQDAGLDRVEVTEGGMDIGGLATIQELEAALGSSGFYEAVSREYGLNVRNTLSLSSFLAQANGRSPILCCLLALKPLVFSLVQPEGQQLTNYLHGASTGDVVVRLHIPEFKNLVFDAVGRSPKDLPITCVATVKRMDDTIQVAYGGTIDIQDGFRLSELDDDGSEQIAKAFAHSDDLWATAEYRQAIAPVLLSRVLQKLETPGRQEV